MKTLFLCFIIKLVFPTVELPVKITFKSLFSYILYKFINHIFPILPLNSYVPSSSLIELTFPDDDDEEDDSFYFNITIDNPDFSYIVGNGLV